MVDATTKGTRMTYGEFITSPEVKTYFGKRYANWAPELETIATKKSILDDDISDQAAFAKVFQSIRFSWLGLLFGLFWYAYHNGKGWQAFLTIVIAAHLIDIIFLESAFGIYITASIAAYCALFMKGWIFASKANEMSENGQLASGSWIRVFLAITLFFALLCLTIIFLT